MSTDALCAYIRDRVEAGAAAVVLHESSDRPLSAAPLAAAGAIILVVGPEGGLTDAEIDALAGSGAVAVRLGPTVLRTSTAAAVALGALGVLTARWSID